MAGQFRAVGLKPAGSKGFFQPVLFRQRRIDEAHSRLAIVRAGGTAEILTLGDDATIGLRNEPSAKVEAPIVFAGYGLQVPEAKYDDLAGLNLKGKIVLLVTGGPATIPGPLLAHYQSTRWSYLKSAGAVGVMAIRNPKGQDIPWERAKLARTQPFLALAEPALDETQGDQIEVTINPASAEKLFAGSGRSAKDILALAEAGRELPRFDIPGSLRAIIAVRTTTLESDNVAAVLVGTDPKLKDEFVVITAHLDHVGKGEPINGDAIYNGAMDNASGVATLIETAAGAAVKGGFRRSLPVRRRHGGGEGASRLALFRESPDGSAPGDRRQPEHRYVPADFSAQERDRAGARGIRSRRRSASCCGAPEDPGPVRSGTGAQRVRPKRSVQLHQGRDPGTLAQERYTKGSADQETVRRWRTERYHAPSDDLAQPVNLQAAEDFNRMYLALVGAVADRPTRPQWYRKASSGGSSRSNPACSPASR